MGRVWHKNPTQAVKWVVKNKKPLINMCRQDSLRRQCTLICALVYFHMYLLLLINGLLPPS